MTYPTLTERKRAKVAAMTAAVETLASDLAAYARRHHGRYILFGSAARGELRFDSDVDIFVDFPTDAQDDAYDIAETRAFALGLRPDLTRKGWSGSRLMAEIAREGQVLDGVTPIAACHPGPVKERRQVRDARWSDVGRDVEAMVRHFQSAARLFRSGDVLAQGSDLDRLMALLHYMQSGHTSLESALIRILLIFDETAPTGSDWHTLLITRCATDIPGSRPAILKPDLAKDAQETRRFRHVAMHSYDITFEPEKTGRAIDAGARLAERLPARLEELARDTDP